MMMSSANDTTATVNTTTTTTTTTTADDEVEDDDGIQVNEEQLPHVILRGDEANLAALRQAPAEYWTQHEAVTPLMEDGIACRATWGDSDTLVVAGEVYLSTSQVLFVATPSTTSTSTSSSSSTEDFAIGATCIHLHAMTEEPELAVYLQLTETTGFNNQEETSEVTLTPLDPEASQVLFDGLCKLVSLNPWDLDEGEDDGPGGELFGGGDDVIWAPARGGGFGDDYDDGAATDEERDAVLERLDNLLVVRPELEIQDGQFEDADEGRFDDAAQ
jgi:hypothetical protein